MTQSNGHHSLSPTESSSSPDEPIHGPRLNGLLHALGLDVDYHRAAGDDLYCRDEAGDEIAVLDLVGGYGSLVLGHHHPDLVAEATQFLASGRPVHAQGSMRSRTQQLAAMLDQRAGGGHHVVFASTGAEAVEAAIKHAMLASGSDTFIALEGAFHGKTLASSRLTGHAAHREPFDRSGPDVPRVRRVRLNDMTDLQAAFNEIDKPAGFIFEPIQGEGGVHPMSPRFAQQAAELCREREVPLIADECQTGMGRTGRFLACEHLGIQPDYVILSKALGGGLAKISALLIRRGHYRSAFDLMHTSTFAGDELSSAIALKAIELTDEALLNRIRDRGDRWMTGLRQLARTYPDVIADVRGRGLMLAVELRGLRRSGSFILRHVSATNDMGLLASSYLLRAHRVRVAPTLSCPNTLRIQPSALINDEEISRAINAIADLCERLRSADAPALTAHLATSGNGEAPVRPLRDTVTVTAYRPDELRGGDTGSPRRVGWLCHLIDEADLVSLEPGYGRYAPSARGTLLNRLAPLANPIVMSEVDVRSATGEAVRLYPILLPVSSAWMKRCLDQGAGPIAAALVQKGVEIAERLGCTLTALGQYTSIVTRGGRSLTTAASLTTGNAYSLALALEAIDQAMRRRNLSPAESTCAVVGAAGNIGQTAAKLLVPRFARTLLMGSRRNRSDARLHRLAASLSDAQVIHDTADLARANVILAATNAVDQPLDTRDLRPGAIVCDLSVPAAVDDREWAQRPDLALIRGGIVRLPFEEDLRIVGFPLPPGRTYGCMAEGLLLGMAGIADRSFTGPVRAENVQRLAALARRHGFTLDQIKDHCVLGTQTRELTHVHACA